MACLGESCSSGLLCVSFVGVLSNFVCVLLSLLVPPFPLGIAGRMWDVTVIISEHCVSILLWHLNRYIK